MHPSPRTFSPAGFRLWATRYRRAAIALLALTVYGSLLPFHFTPRPLGEAVAAFRRAEFFDPSILAARGDWVVSVGQYAVLSYVFMAAACLDRRRAVSFVAALVVVPCCAGVAVAVEFAQLYFPPRTVSRNDILVESLGGVVGAAVWLAAGQRATDWARRLESVTSLAGLAGRMLPAYLLVLLAVQLIPFDFVIEREEIAAKFAEGKIRLTPFGGKADSAAVGGALLNFAALIPLGLLAALARSKGPRPYPAWVGAVIVVAPALVEALQLFVYSRVFDPADVVAGMAGAWAGWRLGRTADPRAWANWASAPRLGPALWLAWLGAVVYFNWQPFDFTADPARFTLDPDDLPALGLRHMSLAPFVDCYWGSKYNALDQFIRKGLSFLPLGVLVALAQRQVYQPSAAKVVATALLVAIALEVGCYFLPTRQPSVTDVLIECAAAWLGYRFTQHVRATLWAETALYGWQRPLSSQLQFINPHPRIARRRAGAAHDQPDIRVLMLLDTVNTPLRPLKHVTCKSLTD